jgi:mono/diheme cytochrome c family protein
MKIKSTIILFGLISILLIVACESESTIEFKRYYSSGAVVYQEHCQNCHGSKGEGLFGLIPPLTDPGYLKDNKSSLACYINTGLKNTIVINKKQFTDVMPPNNLAPMEVAQVITYIQNSFGNKLGLITVDEAEADLEKCK